MPDDPLGDDEQLAAAVRRAFTAYRAPERTMPNGASEAVAAPAERAWFRRMRRWFSSTAATGRGRAVLGGSAVAALAVAVAILGVVTQDPVGELPGPSRPAAAAASATPRPIIELSADVTFEMSATMADATGVDPETDFVLTSAEDLPVEAVLTLLHVEPQVALSVVRESEGRYRVSTGEPLESGEVYRFLIEDRGATAPHVFASFAFQTNAPVGVAESIPGDRATGVPINSGIELTFTQEGVRNVEEHFTIEPAVAGTFEVHRRVVVFVPQGGLAPRTLYTVTVAAGVGVDGSDDVMANDFVLQFETGDSEREGEIAQPPVAFTRTTVESSTAEPPAIELSVWFESAVATLPVRVYAVGGPQAFADSFADYDATPLWATATRGAFVSDVTGLEQVSAFEAPIQRVPQSQMSFIQFPAALPAGFYIVQSDADGHPMQVWLQVTDVATYVAVGRDHTLVWVNDVGTQSALAGARVELLGHEVAGETATDGTLTLETPAAAVQVTPADSRQVGYSVTEVSGNLLVTAPDGRVAVVPLGYTQGHHFGYSGSAVQNVGDDYWRYLSTDRPIYQPTDTIRFWGIARPRQDPGGRTINVQLTTHGGYDGQMVVVAELELETTALGTYSGELSIPGNAPGSYLLTTSVDGQAITSRSVEVQTYTKPAYEIRVTADSLATFAGDDIAFSIHAAFLEGSAVPGLALQHHGALDGEVTTDAAGQATVTVTAGEGPDPSYVGTSSLSVMPVLAEEGEIVGESMVSVFPARLTASARTELDGDQGVISGTVHHVDLSRLNDGTASGPDDVHGAPAQDTSVSLNIVDVSYRETPIGEYYDFVAKVVRTSYTYESVEVPLGTFTATTNSQGEFEHSFAVDPARTYRITIGVTDAEGFTEAQSLYLSGSQSALGYPPGYVYLRGDETVLSAFGAREAAFALGAPVSLAMYRGAEELPSGGANQYLFIEAQNGLRRHFVQGDSTHEFEFGEEHVPGVTVTGVWFTGSTYVPVSSAYALRYDPTEKGLSIEIAPDQERYEPGGEATLALTVTDRDGNPAPNAEVNINVVDEAAFQVQGASSAKPDVLGDLYSMVGSGILRTYGSHQYPDDTEPQGGGATTGGPRTRFVDAAFNGTVTTDASGRASVTFALPDNLTSWRVTAQAFDDRIMAGTAARNIEVGMPFFVDVTLSDEYLATDVPDIRLRSFGSVLEATDQVTFAVSAPSLGIDPAVAVTADGFETVRVAVPGLSEGEHEILIEARSGNFSDSLVRTVRVVPSRLAVATTRFYDVEDGLRVDGSATGPTRVVFSDRERGRYYADLQQLTWSWGDRLDQMLARDVAAELLARFYGEAVSADSFDASAYQTFEGGIALLPYGGPDLALSARAAAVASDRFGGARLVAFFAGVLEDRGETRERQALALYGLAAMDEPVLVSVQALLREPDLTWRERLYAGLALVELGDDTGAREVYEGLITEFAEDVAPALRMRVGDDPDEILEATSLSAILAAGLGDRYAPRLFDYTTQNSTTDILIELERIAYLVEALPRLSPAPVRLAYTVDGERTEVTLVRGESHAIQLTPDELASLRVEPIEGAAGVASFFAGPVDVAAVEADPAITVRRSYSPDPATLQEGQPVHVFQR